MSSETDRAKSGLSKFIRKLLNAFIVVSIDHLASYQCKVISQNSDGTLELQPDDNRLPTYSKVPIRYGVPKISAQVNSGARILLEFASGNPQRPIATLWELDSVTSISFGALNVNLSITSQSLQSEGQDQVFTLDGGQLGIVGGGGQSTFFIADQVQMTLDTTCSVIFPDGTKNVNRVGDGVNSTTAMATWMSQVTAGINGLAPGSVAPAGPSAIGLTTGGNPKVKA